MRRLAISLWFLNAFDAAATWWAVVYMKIAREMNPLMRFLIELGPSVFLMFKMVSMTWLIWFYVRNYEGRMGRPRSMKFLMILMVVVYGLLACTHVYGITNWWLHQ